MIKNFVKIAFRDLLKHKGLTLINISGLSIGLACFTLCLLYGLNEFNYDRFHADSDRIFRVYRWSESFRDIDAEGDPYLPIPLGPALAADLPDVETFIRIRGPWGKNFVDANGNFSDQGISFADPQFFEVFNFPLLYGDPKTALSNLNGLVLTEKKALEIFGESNPVGKTLKIRLTETFEPFVVTGVAKNIPSNSTIHFGLIGNFDRLRSLPRMERRWNNWNHSAYETYLKLRPGSGLPNDEKRLLQLRQKYYPDQEAELRKENRWDGPGAPITYKLQPIRSMHTQTIVAGGTIPPINPKSIWNLLAIATGVLGIACVNFTTLAIGRSAGRSKEVGIRKVMGSNRSALVGQFLTESILLSFISAVIGLGLAYILLPSFNELADRKLVFSLHQFPELSWMYVSTVLVTGLAAGSYPALVLSGFRPIEILKNKMKLGGSNIFTKSLVTGQFILSVGLIIATMVILKQIHFMRSKNPGFAKDNVLVVDAEGTDSKRIFPLFKQAVQNNPNAAGVAGAELSFGAEQGWSRSNWNDNGVQREAFEYFVDDQFLNVLKIQLLAGRNFDPAVSLDTVNSVIINETMMRNFGWTLENAIGQRLNGYYEDPQQVLPVVIGVVKDFHFRPMAEEIRSQLFHQFASYVPMKYLVRMSGGNPETAIASLEKSWRSVEHQLPFKYSFLDEDLDRFYRADMRFGGIVSRAGAVSIFLACLGLFGLVTLTVANRMKEIGIRKVLGASVAGITGLLAKDFLKLVALSILLASPLAWYLMREWLNGFAYRIELHWWIFAIAGVVALGIAFATLSVQSIKAALTNPVKSLRPE